MTSTRTIGVRARRMGVVAALTFASSGLITAATTSAASADELFCEDATVSTFATGTVTTEPICVNVAPPYACAHPDAGLGTMVDVNATICVPD